MQLYRLPNGKIIDMRAHPAMAPVKFCKRWGCMVSKWHEHLTKPGEFLKTTKPAGVLQCHTQHAGSSSP